jgi:hypothetical protein
MDVRCGGVERGEQPVGGVNLALNGLNRRPGISREWFLEYRQMRVKHSSVPDASPWAFRSKPAGDQIPTFTTICQLIVIAVLQQGSKEFSLYEKALAYT